MITKEVPIGRSEDQGSGADLQDGAPHDEP